MNARQLIESLLLEKDGERKYSCIMVPVPQELADIAIAWTKTNVPDDDVFEDEDGGKGRELSEDFHVTAKYGLLMDQPDKHIIAILDDTQPFEISLGTVSLFKNEEFDVLKLDVLSQGLELLNARISELPNEDEHPEFHAHCTLAYVQKDSCDHLVGKKVFDDEELSKSVALSGDGAAFVAESVIFSSPESEKQTILLGSEKTANIGEAKEILHTEYWMDRNGRLIGCPDGHGVVARKILKLPGKYDTGENTYELRKMMFQLGYARLIKEGGKYHVESPTLNSLQWAALERFGIKHEMSILRDTGIRTTDFTVIYEPPIKESAGARRRHGA